VVRLLPWTIKYKPKTTKEIYGQATAVNLLKNWILNFKKQKAKAALIYGPTGSGKTSIPYALANELGLELIEINASDFRNKEQINTKIGSAIKQQSLFSKGKIILVDEIDGLAGREDFGGIAALTALIDTSPFPIIATATDPWNKKFSTLRKKSLLVQLNVLDYKIIGTVLKKICIKERIKYDNKAITALALKVGGDLRAAINDLETLCSGKKELKRDVVDELSDRNKVETILNSLVKIFKTTDPKIAITALDNVDEDLDKVMLWIDENLPKEYKKPDDLARAYDCLSKADIFNRRIKRWQHWRFLVYINALVTAGIAVAKDSKYKEFVEYKPTTRILKLWMAKQKYAKRKAIARKIAENTHSSSKQVIKDTLPYLQVIFQKNKKQADLIAEELELNNEEVEWLRK